ncbi:GNAT family N-acetyltransferase [Kutzneria albida]|uniref:N-acetyltransferase domain-containing protein n=1 Tax=Kutzneria albida DSM 43870 TaxID=1449976 RepID=W5W2Q3_9PSEU|nr:GNAT family N-acetyltransferase [Kutzneria albida]AHH94776.1 hypothetical protein KALB_1403 [Kutzneria albida DSM 43870]
MADTGCKVRSATIEDLAAVAEIYRPYVESTAISFEQEAPTSQQWRARFDNVVNAGLPFLVAEADGVVLGYAYCSPWRTRPAYRRSVESTIYLSGAARGRGLGGQLYTDLLEACREWGAHRVIGVVADSGDPSSLRLHTRLGFREVGRLTEVGHKFGRTWDTVLFEHRLG